MIAAAVFCGWFFIYIGDLPKTEQLSEFQPITGHLATDSCMPGVSFTIPADHIGKVFQDALASAEPRISFSDQIARTLMCNRLERPARYQLDVVRLSWHLRRRFSEQQLFTIYSNRAYFGPGLIGVENASEHFFLKETRNLSPEEAALLAGLLRGPSRFSPITNPDGALQRRNGILETMAAQGRLSAAEAARAVAAPIKIESSSNSAPDVPTKAPNER